MPLEGSESTRNSSLPGDTEGPSSYLQHLHWIAQLDPGHLLLPLSAFQQIGEQIPISLSFHLQTFPLPQRTLSPLTFSAASPLNFPCPFPISFCLSTFTLSFCSRGFWPFHSCTAALPNTTWKHASVGPVHFYLPCCESPVYRESTASLLAWARQETGLGFFYVRAAASIPCCSYL